jgi:hypothetical protein
MGEAGGVGGLFESLNAKIILLEKAHLMMMIIATSARLAELRSAELNVNSTKDQKEKYKMDQIANDSKNLTIEEIRTAILMSDESDATYTDGSTVEELKASQVNLTKPKFDHEEKLPQGIPYIDFDDDELYFYSDGSSAADIIANGQALRAKPESEKK